MNNFTRPLNPSAAARQLGISAKALRLYEQHGLLAPIRTHAGWRTYNYVQMARATQIANLRALGFSLALIGRVLDGDTKGLDYALAEHQAILEIRLRDLTNAASRVRDLRVGIAKGNTPTADELAELTEPSTRHSVAFDLPWPWGGERFELHNIQPLNYIIGPLGSGKTQLARRLADIIPNAAFIGLDRLETPTAHRSRLAADPDLMSKVDKTLTWLTEDGATPCDALLALLIELESSTAAVLVIDMLEQGLDQPTQQAVAAYLRRRSPGAPALFLLTRSNAILDLQAVSPNEAIILCPANHNPPTRVAPYPGAAGYEAVATCLVSPKVRARTAGVIAWRPPAA